MPFARLAPALVLALAASAASAGPAMSPVPRLAAASPQDTEVPRPADPRELLKDPAFQERLKRWRAMSEADKARLRDRYEQWKQLPEPRRETLRMSWVRFRAIPADQQAEAKAWFRKLPEPERVRLRQYADRACSFERMQQIPLHHFTAWVRNLPREEVERIRRLPSDERTEAIRRLNHRFYDHIVRKVEAQLPEAEREAFRSLPADETLARVRKWYAERKAVEAEKRGQFPWWEREPSGAPARPREPRAPDPGRKAVPVPPPPAAPPASAAPGSW